MAQQSQPVSPNSPPGFGALFGLLLAGAMLGASAFGAVVAIFAAIRDQARLKWSEELIILAIG
jgi:hypothetical protein